MSTACGYNGKLYISFLSIRIYIWYLYLDNYILKQKYENKSKSCHYELLLDVNTVNCGNLCAENFQKRFQKFRRQKIVITTGNSKSLYHRRIQNPVKHLQRSILRKKKVNDLKQ